MFFGATEDFFRARRMGLFVTLLASTESRARSQRAWRSAPMPAFDASNEARRLTSLHACHLMLASRVVIAVGSAGLRGGTSCVQRTRHCAIRSRFLLCGRYGQRSRARMGPG